MVDSLLFIVAEWTLKWFENASGAGNGGLTALNSEDSLKNGQKLAADVFSQ